MYIYLQWRIEKDYLLVGILIPDVPSLCKPSDQKSSMMDIRKTKLLLILFSCVHSRGRRSCYPNSSNKWPPKRPLLSLILRSPQILVQHKTVTKPGFQHPYLVWHQHLWISILNTNWSCLHNSTTVVLAWALVNFCLDYLNSFLTQVEIHGAHILSQSIPHSHMIKQTSKQTK